MVEVRRRYGLYTTAVAISLLALVGAILHSNRDSEAARQTLIMQQLNASGAVLIPTMADAAFTIDDISAIEFRDSARLDSYTVSLLGELPHLDSVYFENCNLQNSHLAELCRLTRLEHLIVRGDTVSVPWGPYLTQLTRLKTLSLVDCSVQLDVGRVSASLPELNILNCRNSRVEWQRLAIRPWGVPHLVFSGTNIDDSAIHRLLTVQVLDSLDLSDCELSDDAIVTARQIGGLKSLDVSGTKITRNALEQLGESQTLQRVFARRMGLGEEGERDVLSNGCIVYY